MAKPTTVVRQQERRIKEEYTNDRSQRESNTHTFQGLLRAYNPFKIPATSWLKKREGGRWQQAWRTLVCIQSDTQNVGVKNSFTWRQRTQRTTWEWRAAYCLWTTDVPRGGKWIRERKLVEQGWEHEQPLAERRWEECRRGGQREKTCREKRWQPQGRLLTLDYGHAQAASDWPVRVEACGSLPELALMFKSSLLFV